MFSRRFLSHRPLNNVNPWVEQVVPGSSGLKYYWNIHTNESTLPGASKPIHWLQVTDSEGLTKTYWSSHAVPKVTAVSSVTESILPPSMGNFHPPAPRGNRLLTKLRAKVLHLFKAYAILCTATLTTGAVGACVYVSATEYKKLQNAEQM